MDRRHHEYRRRLLLARHAFVQKFQPSETAACIVDAARELILQKGEIPREMLQEQNREAICRRLAEADLREPIKLLAQAHRLAAQANRLRKGSQIESWQRKAYRLLQQLDFFLIDMVAADRTRRAAPRYLAEDRQKILPQGFQANPQKLVG